MKTLITGATGFLGGAVARSFSPEEVILTGRNPQKASMLRELGYTLKLADLSDSRVMNDLFAYELTSLIFDLVKV